MAKKRRRLVDSSKTREVPVEYYGMDEVDIQYADGLVVQNDENGFFVSFFQAEHPIALTEEAKARISKIRTKCITRLFISPMLMEVAIKALESNFQKYNALYIEDDKKPDTDTDESIGQEESNS